MPSYWKDAEAAFIAQAQDTALGPRKRKKNLPKGAASDSDEDQLKVGRYPCCVVKNHDYSHTEILFTTALILTNITLVIFSMSYHHLLHTPCSS